MSKAFTRESDDAEEEPLPPRASSSLPAGAKNYLTQDGAERFRSELSRLQEQRAALLATAADDPDAKRRARLLEQRAAQIEEILTSAEVVAPAGCDPDEVCFGSTVTVREPDGSQYDYRIVGVDEIDLDRGWVSWLSPIARALMNAKQGQRVPFRFPSGEKELEIVTIRTDPDSR